MISRLIPLLLAAASLRAETPSLDDILKHLVQSDAQRRSLLRGYTSLRHYTVENTRFHVKATMRVRLEVDADGAKKFTILDTTGPGPVRKLVFQRMLNTEAKASAKGDQAANRISPDNYSFKFVEATTLNGRPSYILEAEPKSTNPNLFRGRVWIDAEDFAVTRLEGAPAQKPSVWVIQTRFVHEYAKFGSQWLATRNRSDSDIRLFGRSTTEILYSDYVFPPAQ